MTGSRPAIALIIGLFALLLGGAARAEGEDLSAGKTPEQLFRLNCAACHKSPRGLAKAGDKAGGLFGLENFLAQHYTASGRSADLIAGYLKSVDSGASPERRGRPPHRRASKPTKPDAAKADTVKTDTAKQSAKPDKDKRTGEAKAGAPKVDGAKANTTDKTTDKTTDEKSAQPETDKPKTDKPAMTEPKPDKKEPASQASQVKREKPKAAERKTD